MRTHTEYEAKKLWCPMARTGVLSATVVAVNRHIDMSAIMGECACLGSGCAMWQWKLCHEEHRRHYSPADKFASTEPERPANVPATWEWFSAGEKFDEAMWLEPQSEADKRRRGYCGLITQVNISSAI